MKLILKIWKGENAKAERAKHALETLFLALAGVYLIYLFTITTTLYVPYPLKLERTMIISMAAVTAARLALIGPKNIEIWLAAALALVYNAVHRVDGYGLLWFLAVLTLGCVRVDYRRVLKTWLIAVGGAFALTVIAALAGGIQNIVYYRDGLRSSWGICYPTDLATISLFLLLMLWVTWRSLPDWALLPLGAASILLSASVTMSRNSLICSALFCCVIGYHWLESAVLAKRPRWKWVTKGVNGLLTAAFPLFAAAFFLMVWLYAKGLPIGMKLDALLSERLRQSLDGIRNYGIHPFGTPFDQTGNGFSVFPQKVNFIDSSYMLILLRYGWVLLLVLCLLWGWTIRKAIRCGDRRLALAMGLIAFHSILEHHFSEANYNILLVMPFAAYAVLPQGEGKRPERARIVAGLATMLLTVLAAALGGPWLMTRLRTLFQARGHVGGKAGALPVIAATLAVAAVALAALWAVYRLIRALMAGKREKTSWTRPLALLLLCAGVSGGLLAWSNGVLDHAAAENAELIEADRPVLELVLSAARNPVYVDDLPDLYQREFEGLLDSALPLEDLARRPGCTVLARADEEYNVFFQRDFRYVQISERHAVYTADPAVIEALSSAGFALSDYYDSVRHVNLEEAAELNELPYDERYGALLDGPEQSMALGAYLDLYGGLYTAVYALRLPEDAPDAPGPVCRISVTSFEGETALAETVVSREQFDADGRLEMPVAFEFGYAPSLQFMAFAADGRQVWVEDIRYVKERGLISE